MAWEKPVSRWTKRRRTYAEFARLLDESAQRSDEKSDNESGEFVQFPQPCANASSPDIFHSTSFDTVADISDACKCESLSNSDIEEPISFNEIDSECPPVDTPECESGDESLIDDLAGWAASNNIALSALGGLLKILRKCHPDLPKDP